MTAVRVPPPPFSAGPRGALAVSPDGRGVVLAWANGSGVEINQVGSILLIVGIAGIILSTLLLLWSFRRRHGLWLAGV